MTIMALIAIIIGGVFAFSWWGNRTAVVPVVTKEVVAEKNKSLSDFSAINQKTAIVAGGCFWCVEADFDKLDGVIATVSGYSGDVDKLNPTYRDHGNHVEVVQITYDADVLSYEDLIKYYYTTVDYTDAWWINSVTEEMHIFLLYIQRMMHEVCHSTCPWLRQGSVVPVIPATKFWKAEEYHQDYYIKNPVRYKYYRSGCGRDQTDSLA